MKTKIPQHQAKRFKYLNSLLRNLRHNDGYSQKMLAEQADIHYNTVYNSENMHNITLLSLFELIDAYGISVADIFQDME
jgi:DNA-binding XRE family transcriptional regulator